MNLVGDNNIALIYFSSKSLSEHSALQQTVIETALELSTQIAEISADYCCPIDKSLPIVLTYTGTTLAKFFL